MCKAATVQHAISVNHAPVHRRALLCATAYQSSRPRPVTLGH